VTVASDRSLTLADSGGCARMTVLLDGLLIRLLIHKGLLP
jgi:hypothetical protein